MTKPGAIDQAVTMYDTYGGVWHVVKIEGRFYDVSQAWMDLPRNKNVVSEFSVGTIDNFEKELSVVGKIIEKFNIFLLWLFKPLLNARRNKSKT